jgi:hypothetical protein
LKPIVVDQQAYLILVEEIIQPQLDEEMRQHIMRDLFAAWLKQELKKYQPKLTFVPAETELTGNVGKST